MKSCCIVANCLFKNIGEHRIRLCVYTGQWKLLKIKSPALPSMVWVLSEVSLCLLRLCWGLWVKNPRPQEIGGVVPNTGVQVAGERVQAFGGHSRKGPWAIGFSVLIPALSFSLQKDPTWNPAFSLFVPGIRAGKNIGMVACESSRVAKFYQHGTVFRGLDEEEEKILGQMELHRQS